MIPTHGTEGTCSVSSIIIHEQKTGRGCSKETISNWSLLCIQRQEGSSKGYFYSSDAKGSMLPYPRWGRDKDRGSHRRLHCTTCTPILPYPQRSQ